MVMTRTLEIFLLSKLGFMGYDLFKMKNNESGIYNIYILYLSNNFDGFFNKKNKSELEK